MVRKAAIAFGQGDFFRPEVYDRDAVEWERASRRYLARKNREAEALEDELIWERAAEQVARTRALVEWARASYGSYTRYLALVVREGLGADGQFNPRKNGTARRIYRQEIRALKGKRRLAFN